MLTLSRLVLRSSVKFVASEKRSSADLLRSPAFSSR